MSKVISIKEVIGVFFSFCAFFALQLITTGARSALITFAAAFFFLCLIFVSKGRLYKPGKWSLKTVCLVLMILLIGNIYASADITPSIMARIGLSDSPTCCITVQGFLSVLSIPALVYLVFFSLRTDYTHPLGRFSSLSKPFFLCCNFIAFAGIAAMIYASFSYSIGLDEDSTLAMIKADYGRLMDLVYMDALHPPLYYLFLKFSTYILCSIFPELPLIFASKLLSVVPYLFFVIICLTFIKKIWGNCVAGLSLVAVCCMPRMLEIGINIRMYAWTSLWVMCCYLQAYCIMQKSTLFRWFLFAVFGLLALYTNYWGGIAVGFVYLYMCIWCIRVDRKSLVKWVISVIISVTGFLPWLTYVIGSARMLGTHSWFMEISINNICGLLICYTQNVILIMGILVCLYMMTRKYRGSAYSLQCSGFAMVGIGIPILMLGFAIVVGLVYAPILRAHHLIPGLFTMWLGVCISIYYVGNINLKKYVMILILSTAIVNIVCFIYDEKIQAASSLAFINDYKDDAYIAFVSSSEPRAQTVTQLLNHPSYVYKRVVAPLYKAAYSPQLKELSDTSEIRKIISSGKKVYYIADKPEDAEAFSEETKLELHKVNSYSIRGMWYIYQVLSI